jgi:hypothetical protein
MTSWADLKVRPYENDRNGLIVQADLKVRPYEDQP